MSYKITENCIGCGACARKCPEGAIIGQPKTRHIIDSLFCRECGMCSTACGQGALLDQYGRRLHRQIKTKSGLNAECRAYINTAICAACKNCLLNCPQQAISIRRKGLFWQYHCTVDQRRCVGCGNCVRLCIMGAISMDNVIVAHEGKNEIL